MKKIIKLTESDLIRIVKRVIKENVVTTQTTTVSNPGGGGGEEENVYAKRETLNGIWQKYISKKVIGNQYPSGSNAANTVDNKNGTINFYTTESSKANKDKAYLRKYIVTCSNPVSINDIPSARWSDEPEYYNPGQKFPITKLASDMATEMCKVFYPNKFLK